MSKEIKPLDQTKQLINKMEGQFANALPKQIPSKKFIRTVLTAISDPIIADKINDGSLDIGSVISECTKAAQDGLLLDGREATLLTFWNGKKKINEAGYVPMVAGLMKKARNSGEIVSITANVIFENDEFDHWIDEKGVHFTYRPCKKSAERGAPDRVFALGITKDGGSQLEVLERSDIDAIASFSKNSYQYDPSKGQWFQEWWKKAAIRRVCKYLPSSSELDRLFEHDNESFDFVDPVIDVPQEQPAPPKSARSTKSAMKKAVAESVDKATGEVIEGELVPDMPDMPDYDDDDFPI